MRLCTSDSTGWGEVTGTTERSVLGTRDSDGAGVEVPPGGPPGHPGRALRPGWTGPGPPSIGGAGRSETAPQPAFAFSCAMICWKVSRGWAPDIARVPMKKKGVPSIPIRRPSAVSFLTAVRVSSER